MSKQNAVSPMYPDEREKADLSFIGFRRYLVLLRKNAIQMLRNPGYLAAEIIIFFVIIGVSGYMYYMMSQFDFDDNDYSTYEIPTYEYNNYQASNENVLLTAYGPNVNVTEFNKFKTTLSNNSVDTLTLKIEKDYDKLITALKEKFQYWSSDHYVLNKGLYITELDFSKGILTYEIIVKGSAYEISGININNGWQETTADYRLKFYEQNIVNRLQHTLDMAFYEITAKTVNKPKSLYSLKSQPLYIPNRRTKATTLEQMFLLRHSVLMCIVMFSVRSILYDKENMKDFMAVMGVTDTVFYLSHTTFLLIKQIILITPIVIILCMASKIANIYIILISTLIEYFAIIALCILISSIWSSIAVATFMTILIYGALSVSGMFVSSSPVQSGWTILYMLNPWIASGTLIKIMNGIQAIENKYTFDDLFLSKNLMFPGYIPLAFMIGDIILMIIVAFLIENGKELFSCTKMRVFPGDSEKKKVYENAEEIVDVGNAKVDIQIKDVTKIYKTGQRAVHGLNLTALRGQVTVLLGHNGAGKSTTFSMICGTEKPTNGTVSIVGSKAGSWQAKRHVGYCSQKNTLVPDLTVMDHLKLSYGLKCATSDFQAEAEKLLKLVGLLEYKSKKTKKLSGGQKRKVCLCMALIGSSEVVLLDEPTAGMDVESRQDVEIFLNTQKGSRTILLTTHYMDEAESLGDRIFIMSGGRVVCSGSADFLKRRFASGYTLTVLAAAKQQNMGPISKQLENRIVFYAPSAKITDIRGVQMEFLLPIDSKDAFPSLFEDLERNKEQLGIANFGLSMNNLEHVFLKVGHATEENEGNKDKNEEKLRGLMKSVYGDGHQKGVRLILSQFSAMFQKKFLYSLNSVIIFFLFQITVPIVCLIVCFILIQPGLFEKKTTTEGWNTGVVDFGPGAIITKGAGSTGAFEKEMSTFLSREKEKNRALILQERPDLDLEKAGFMITEPMPAMAFVFNESKTNTNNLLIRYNQRHFYSLPTALNLFANERLQSVVPDGRITTFVTIFSISNGVGSFLGGIGPAILLPATALIMALIFSHFTEPMAVDVCTGFLYQQMLAGVYPWVYWLTEYIYAFILYVFQCSFYIASLYVLGLDLETLKKFAILVILLFFTVMPMVCGLAVTCKTSSTATTTVALLMTVGIMGVGVVLLIGLVVLNFVFANDDSIPVKERNSRMFSAIFTLSYFLTVLLPCMPFFFGTVVLAIGPIMAKEEAEIKMFEKQYVIYTIIMAAMAVIYTFIFAASRFKFVKTKISCGKGKPRLVPPLTTKPPPCDTSAVLNMQDVSKVFGRKPVLAHVNFDVKKNECFGLLGVSGAGKTTAFNIITAQLLATAGDVTLEGTNVTSALIIGLCPQFDTLQPKLKGRQSLSILAKVHGYKNVPNVVNMLIEMVDMKQHAEKRFDTCSGGQKRRLSVAAALLPRKSPFVILDEATAGIDPVARRDVWSVLSVVREQSAILMSSHSMEECEALCSRIAILRAGQVAATGTSQELKSRLGNFYVLSIAVSSIQDIPKAVEMVQHAFPGSILQPGSFSRNLKWKVPRRQNDLWSQMFHRSQMVAQRLAATDFFLTQPSLQDIFLIIAQNTEAQNEAPLVMEPPPVYSVATAMPAAIDNPGLGSNHNTPGAPVLNGLPSETTMNHGDQVMMNALSNGYSGVAK